MIVIVAMRGREVDPILRRPEIVGYVGMIVRVNDSAVLVGVHAFASSLTSNPLLHNSPSAALESSPSLGPSELLPLDQDDGTLAMHGDL